MVGIDLQLLTLFELLDALVIAEACYTGLLVALRRIDFAVRLCASTEVTVVYRLKSIRLELDSSVLRLNFVTVLLL